MRRRHLAAAVVLALWGLAPQEAAARARNAPGPILGYVTAHSIDGNGSIRAPYRRTPVGYQIRLPHGTWVYCRTSCSETLRVETIDIWANVNNGTIIGAGTIQNECGALGCLRWSWGLGF
jgi:hypothetical protein